MADRYDLIVIGGGLAGSEAGWQAAERGLDVALYEMRPHTQTPAHVSGYLAELVCSNSLGSNLPDRAGGLLKAELRRMDSLLIRCADETAVPAGGALAVGRERFAQAVTQNVEAHPRISLIREEMKTLPDMPTVVASGPLTAPDLAAEIGELTGQNYLYFYDALAPIVLVESIDMSTAFRASRYGRGDLEEGDYINCPMNEEEYNTFVEALLSAEKIELRDFEREDPHFFEGCLPIEQMAARSKRSLAFGPMRPVGLTDPRTGKRPHAVVQLRQDNLAGTLYNLVGFQTNLKWSDQKRVLRMIPGLENAEFVRYGMMHRNTFINAPTLLHSTMQFRTRNDLFFAGQITGVEGYVGNIATGLLAGTNAANCQQDKPMWDLPKTTMSGALTHYITHTEPKDFQPMKANFGLMPPLVPRVRKKRERQAAYSRRALADLDAFLSEHLE